MVKLGNVKKKKELYEVEDGSTFYSVNWKEQEVFIAYYNDGIDQWFLTEMLTGKVYEFEQGNNQQIEEFLIERNAVKAEVELTLKLK
jgi:hypothetical protein